MYSGVHCSGEPLHVCMSRYPKLDVESGRDIQVRRQATRN